MDINSLAKHIVDQAIGEKPAKKRNPRAANRGIARAAALTKEQRTDIAKRAASQRWAKSNRNVGE